jgi:hypothetical protein
LQGEDRSRRRLDGSSLPKRDFKSGIVAALKQHASESVHACGIAEAEALAGGGDKFGGVFHKSSLILLFWFTRGAIS